jgi:transposase-like protein
MGEARKKRRWKPEEIARVLRRVHLDRVEVSKVCEETGCCPSQVYRWQKELFDQSGLVFERASGSGDKRARARTAATVPHPKIQPTRRGPRCGPRAGRPSLWRPRSVNGEGLCWPI